ncbi:MAG: ABC transporter permease [Candidatus Berkelbacteria bacterium]|nr:MAG: ABC transporter permease [Candidatus Berkelbacteria bacterium]QQG51962.1 MAG: ABC transporter permease [Candidatus Berkelbacteria bacterium]
MFLIALRNLFGERGRLLITIGGVTFSVILILILLGLYSGWEKQMTRFTGNIPADLWVGQAGSGDLSHSISIIQAVRSEDVSKLGSVTRVSTFVGRQVGTTIDGQDVHIFVVGVDEDRFIKSYELVEGTDDPALGEIAIDQVLARQTGLKIGDTFEVAKTTVKVSGIISGGNILAYTFALVNRADVKNILDLDGLVNYYLVQTPDPDQATIDIAKQFPDYKVMTKTEFLENNKSILTETFLPIIKVLLIIAVLIGIAVIGLTIFTATIEKSREYGVLKALGYTGAQIYGIGLIQSVTAGAIGFVVGAILAPLFAIAATNIASGFLYEVSGGQVILVFAAVVGMAIIASFMPLKRLLVINPASVFKA